LRKKRTRKKGRHCPIKKRKGGGVRKKLGICPSPLSNLKEGEGGEVVTRI